MFEIYHNNNSKAMKVKNKTIIAFLLDRRKDSQFHL